MTGAPSEKLDKLMQIVTAYRAAHAALPLGDAAPQPGRRVLAEGGLPRLVGGGRIREGVVRGNTGAQHVGAGALIAHLLRHPAVDGPQRQGLRSKPCTN